MGDGGSIGLRTPAYSPRSTLTLPTSGTASGGT